MTTPGPGGYLHLLPLQIDRTLTVDTTIASMLPWQMPGLMAVSGLTQGDSQVPVLAVCYEHPISWLRTVQDIGQFELELLHLHRFRTDHILAAQTAPFLNVDKGNDPPDAVVTTDSGTLGIECTGLTIGERRGAHGLFRSIRQCLGRYSPAVFSGLSGCMVYMWFNESDSVLTRPYRSNDEKAAQELVEALVQYRPQPENLWVPAGTGPPQRAPDLKMHRTTAGASFYCTPMVGAAPSTPLFAMTGFEIGFAFTTTHESEAEWDKLTKRIAAKDRPGSDWLLISAGAPDQRGNLYPAEEALADFLLDNHCKIGPFEHLKQVTIHSWSTGKAVDIWPEVKPLFGPLYQTTVPSCQPLVMPTDSVSPDT